MEVSVDIIKKMSIFPNGEKIYNDKLVHNLHIVYNLMDTYDGRAVLYFLIFKSRYGRNSSGALTSKVKNFRKIMHSELGLIDSRGRIQKDLRNTLLYLDEENELLLKLHRATVLGKKHSYKMTLTLDQYDPETGQVFKCKGSYKAYRDEDFLLSDALRNFLRDLGRE